MKIKPTPPPFPAELSNRFGEPEEIFGPNQRFRVLSPILGLILLFLGVAFFVARTLLGEAQTPFALHIGTGLLGLGIAAFFLPLLLPIRWVFVCPGGLARGQGQSWHTLSWSEAVRFEDASLSKAGVRARQCRIIKSDGTEVGFIAEYVSDYDRLVAILRNKVESRAKL